MRDLDMQQDNYPKDYALYHLGNYAEAMQYLDESLVIDPNYKEALIEKVLFSRAQVIIHKQYNIMIKL